MGLTLDQLVFDPTGPSEGGNVGAFLRDSLGNLITSTVVGGHQALDVNVVAISPQPDTAPGTQTILTQDIGSTSSSGANGQPIVTGSPTATSVASFALSTQETIRVQASGTWTGTLTAEVSLDGGTTWYPTNVIQNTLLSTPSFSANFEGVAGVAGATNFRIRATAAMTGAAVIQVVESLNSAVTYVNNALRLIDASGTAEASIKAASTAALATDTSLVVALSPNSPLPTGANTIGAVTQGTTPWVDNLTQVGGSAISLGQKVMASSFPVVIASDQSAINVNASQAGSWTVTANQGTSPWVDNVSQFGGNAVVTGTGASGLGIPRVTVSNDSNILATQSGTWTVQQGTPPWSVVGNIADGTADADDPVKTGTRASFGSALSAIGASNDRADMISDRYRRLYVSGSADVAVKNTAVTVTLTAAALLGSQLQGRRKIYIQNNSSKQSIYLGSSGSVTSSNGLKIAAGAVYEDEIGEDVSIFVIGDAASVDCRVFEIA